MTLKRTPLYEIHKKLGARMVEFGGWEMPVHYSGLMEEHRAVRKAVGLFDISHMGEIFVTGKNARDFINSITTNDINRIADGGCQYAACCYEHGGVVDDVISYQVSSQKYLVVVNASNTDKDFEWFQRNNRHGVTIENKSPGFCQLALQGPLAERTLQPLVDFPLSRITYYHFCETRIDGKPVILSRTGYTGENGFEMYGPWNDAPFLWKTLMDAGRSYGIKPVGLGARDTLRLEAAYSLYGHEILGDINPLEARLAWIVKLDKREFIGKKALQKIAAEGIRRKIVGIQMMDAGIPRQGYEVFANEKKVGRVTSGTFSPTLKKAIGLALVETDWAVIGGELLVQIRKQQMKAKVVALPFYKKS